MTVASENQNDNKKRKIQIGRVENSYRVIICDVCHRRIITSLVQEKRKGLALRYKVPQDKCAEKGCRGESNKGRDFLGLALEKKIARGN